MTKERLSREERSRTMRETRQRAILAAAVEEAEANGFANIVRNRVAERAGVANGSVNHAFGTLAALKDAVMTEAVATHHEAIIAQGLAAGHPIAREAPAALRKMAARALA